MVDWNFWDTKKKITVAAGAGALVVALVVLGATVVRVSNLRSTIERPKAADSCQAPDNCCSGVKSDPFACAWPARGWCTYDQCGGEPKAKGNQNCGLFYWEYCGGKNKYGSGGCTADTKNDSNNCGSCGHKCDPGQVCSYSNCLKMEKSCAVSLSSLSVKAGEPVTINFSGKINSGWDIMSLWLSKQNRETGQTTTDQISPVPSPLGAGTYDYGNGVWQYPINGWCNTNGSDGPCKATINPASNPLPIGKYNVFCAVGSLAADGTNAYNACSGQPLCNFPGAGGGVSCGNWRDCGSGSRAVLTVGSASPTCPTGQTLCGTSCVDLYTDAKNCGTCDNVCATGNICVNKACIATPSTACTTPANCADDKTCVSGACVTPTCNPTPTACQTATYANHACTLINKADGTVCETNKTCTNGVCGSSTSEVSACWGNQGANGKCIDCDGNGVINVLDFSCFKNRYGQTVS